MLQFLLGIELDSQFGENDDVVIQQALVASPLDLSARPIKPFRVARQDISNDAGIDQDHVSPRVSRSQSWVFPLIFPPRNNVATARRPGGSFPALTTRTPSGWSTNSTGHCGRSPCLRRMAGGMVTWPLPVILMERLLLSAGAGVNARADKVKGSVLTINND